MSVLGKLYTLFCGITFFALLLTHGLVQAVRLVAPSHTLCVLRMLYKCEGNFNLCLSMYWYALLLFSTILITIPTACLALRWHDLVQADRSCLPGAVVRKLLEFANLRSSHTAHCCQLSVCMICFVSVICVVLVELGTTCRHVCDM